MSASLALAAIETRLCSWRRPAGGGLPLPSSGGSRGPGPCWSSCGSASVMKECGFMSASLALAVIETRLCSWRRPAGGGLPWPSSGGPCWSSYGSATGLCKEYDVFLSFRGTDTRNSFTSHLYKALCDNNIKAFIDKKLDRGQEITPALMRVIEGAKISIIVLSPDYASSTFTLDELVKIMECNESKAQTVLPIFYKVYPSQTSYREAFARHKANIKGGEERRCDETIKQEMTKVMRWESAFCKALNLAGWHIDDNSDEAEIIGEISREVMKKLNCEASCQSKGEELISTALVGQTAEANLEKIWECLMDDEISIVGVYGIGGVGKTTTVTHINNRLLADANSFTHIYWVAVSKDSSIYKLQSDIAKVIGLDISGEDDNRKRASKLWKKLDRKKFVLILDDVWEAFETENVGIPLLVGGGKLLLTTRKLQVCRRMECQRIKVERLSQQEACHLFMKESKFQVNDSLEWREIVESVVRECAGLPLAIVVVARRMRGIVEISEWRNILRELEKPCEGQNHEMEEEVFKPLKVSYDRLPNDKYRQCLWYCSLFPEDYKIERNVLIEYWIKEGLIEKLDSRQAELDKGNAILNEFIYSSLLEHGKSYEKDFVKMHDVIRDMTHVIAGENFKIRALSAALFTSTKRDDARSRQIFEALELAHKALEPHIKGIAALDRVSDMPREFKMLKEIMEEGAKWVFLSNQVPRPSRTHTHPLYSPIFLPDALCTRQLIKLEESLKKYIGVYLQVQQSAT